MRHFYTVLARRMREDLSNPSDDRTSQIIPLIDLMEVPAIHNLLLDETLSNTLITEYLELAAKPVNKGLKTSKLFFDALKVVL